MDIIKSPGSTKIVAGTSLVSLRKLLNSINFPYKAGDKIAIKLHWGERGNLTYLPPIFAREIVTFLREKNYNPFVFDTTVLYSGGRRTAKEAIETASEHGYREDFLQCPVVIADGIDGNDITDIPAGYRHFKDVQVASLVRGNYGFLILSHFKAHMAAGFGGAIKNISMGFSSRAQKQRIHAEVHPELEISKCTKCGSCLSICPTGAAYPDDNMYPCFNRLICTGCAQCIAACPELALRILWDDYDSVFQEKLIETAAAVWRIICGRTIVINVLINIVSDCDCMPGKHAIISPDFGFVGGYHPLDVDEASLKVIGHDIFNKAHPGIPWQAQLSYAKQISFLGRSRRARLDKVLLNRRH